MTSGNLSYGYKMLDLQFCENRERCKALVEGNKII
jgi:hypothetical protein